MNTPKGKIILIPTFLGESSYDSVMPARIREEISRINYFAVENIKTARRYIKKVHPAAVIDSLTFFPIGKHSLPQDIEEAIRPALEGNDVGVISEAGVPAVADPGASIVALAHKKGLTVVPLCGPSSILMGLMASGLSGQNFAFHGYLPIDKNERKSRLLELERASSRGAGAQIFIETPFRNMQMFSDLLSMLSPHTMLCVACDITTPTEYICTQPVERWKKVTPPPLHKRPTVFIIQNDR
ncbi:MAG: SAM-dependent methyltransferase [Flavobacteriales bacterium]|nr:SAM-dependent methyltransferase [Flavobacteriales bacterium]